MGRSPSRWSGWFAFPFDNNLLSLIKAVSKAIFNPLGINEVIASMNVHLLRNNVGAEVDPGLGNIPRIVLLLTCWKIDDQDRIPGHPINVHNSSFPFSF